MGGPGAEGAAKKAPHALTWRKVAGRMEWDDARSSLRHGSEARDGGGDERVSRPELLFLLRGLQDALRCRPGTLSRFHRRENAGDGPIRRPDARPRRGERTGHDSATCGGDIRS